MGVLADKHGLFCCLQLKDLFLIASLGSFEMLCALNMLFGRRFALFTNQFGAI